jgi:hypothetical protein
MSSVLHAPLRTFPFTACACNHSARIPLTSFAISHWTAVSRRGFCIVNQSR